ncbi:MAG TPA: L,D-transpeptidase family protein [Nanoarchaeota archaeon]|nr:L,D-transpeptidase family protein [Nanoarchaeota archaeon]
MPKTGLVTLLCVSAVLGPGSAAAQEAEEEPNAITAPFESMIEYYEANEISQVSFNGHREITLSTEAERVMKTGIEQALIDSGYLPEGHIADSCFDEDTIEAVKQLQEDNGLREDGVVGHTTIPLLNEITGMDIDAGHYSFSLDSACELNDEDHMLISEIEEALNFHHYSNLAVDGELDDATVEAIRLYKRRNIIGSDSIDCAFVDHLSTGSRARIRKLNEALAALESLSRHGPGTESNIYVNLPEQQVRFYYHNNLEFQMDIIIGQRGRWRTDIQEGTMREARINPWWNVPASIISEQRRVLRREPALRQVTEQRINGRWELIGDNPVIGDDFRQRPGELNPFGRIYYNFGGPEGELLHGTAKHYLFRETTRLFSHGCMRLHDEAEFFYRLQDLGLIDDSLYLSEMVETTGSDGLYLKQDVPLIEPIHVNVIYVRAWVDSGENGIFMAMPKDVYGYGKSKVRRYLGFS